MLQLLARPMSAPKGRKRVGASETCRSEVSLTAWKDINVGRVGVRGHGLVLAPQGVLPGSLTSMACLGMTCQKAMQRFNPRS